MPRKYLKDFEIKKSKVKYPLVDVNRNLRGKTITVHFWIEHVPVFGWIHRVT